MIRSIKVELNAAFPQMPLVPFQVFHDSAAAVTILNVPRRIVSLSLKVKNVSGVEQTFAAQRSGSSWGVVVPASFFSQSGTSTKGVKVIGVDADANAFTLGAADLVVLLDDGTVSPVHPSGDGDMKHSEFSDLEAPDNMTQKESNQLLKTIVSKLKGPAVLLLSACCLSSLAAITPDTDFGDVSPTNKLGEVVTAAGATSTNDFITATNNLASSVSGLQSSVSGLQSSKADRSEIPGNYPAVSNKAMTAVQVETDPTVPAWAKQANPPEGMPTTGLVWNATSGAVKTANGAKTIGAADVGAYGKSNSFQINGGNGISVGSNLTDEHSPRAEIEGGSLTFFDGYGGSTRFDPYGYIYSTSGGMWQFPIGISGTVMVESWQSLSGALDASTNATALASVGAKMMTLIDQPVEQKINQSVSSHLNTHVDGATGVEYEGKWYGGSMYFVPTGNVYPPNN